MSTKSSYADSATSPDQATLAERLIALADCLYEGGRDKVVYINQDPGEVNLARMALGLALRNRPKVFILRAIVENWSQERLMREMY